MKEDLIKLIENKSPGSIPLFLVIRGSHAYGTNIETSDVDYAGVFIQPIDDILGTKYKEQLNDDKNDIVIYELRRFLSLMGTNNPTVLELLNTPEDCILYKHPIFDQILNCSEDFITKLCANSFGGYAIQQIKKAKGQNKKQNWEKDKVERKDILDFCYVLEDGKSVSWRKWNKEKRYEDLFIGASSIPNARDVYSLFYDFSAELCFSERHSSILRRIVKSVKRLFNEPLGLGFKGLINVGEDENGKVNYGLSNQLRLSSIPKSKSPICTIIYNKDGYSEHCKDYTEYQEWLSKRNEQRWVDVKSHGQKIDGKNMMHCVRLIDMVDEISEGKGIIVRRSDEDIKKLISIRRGEVDLDSLIMYVDEKIIKIDEKFKNSDLPNSVDKDLIDRLIVKIRREVYGL